MQQDFELITDKEVNEVGLSKKTPCRQERVEYQNSVLGLYTLGSSPAHRTVPAAGCPWPRQSCSSPESPCQPGSMGHNRGKGGTESSYTGSPLRAFLPLPARRESRCQQQQPCKRTVTVLSAGSWSLTSASACRK